MSPWTENRSLMPKSILPASLQIRTSGSASRASFWCLWCLASKASCLSLQMVCGGLRLAVWYFTSIWVEDPHSMAASYLWSFFLCPEVTVDSSWSNSFLVSFTCFSACGLLCTLFQLDTLPLFKLYFFTSTVFLDSQPFLKSLPTEQYCRNLGLITHYL